MKSVLERIGCFAGYIDNDIRKQKTSADGGGAMSLEQYMCLEHKGIIVIAVDQKYAPDIEEQLTEKQLQKGRHYFIWDEFCDWYIEIAKVRTWKEGTDVGFPSISGKPDCK